MKIYCPSIIMLRWIINHLVSFLFFLCLCNNNAITSVTAISIPSSSTITSTVKGKATKLNEVPSTASVSAPSTAPSAAPTAAATVPPSSPTSLNVSVISWNMAEIAPTEEECEFLRAYQSQDIVVVGIQECENIRPRRSAGHRDRKWKQIHNQMFPKNLFKCIARHKMGGLLLAVFVKRSLIQKKNKLIKGVQIFDVACGVGNVLTNKGAIVINLRFPQHTLCLINAHMAAHQKKVKERNADYKRIMNTLIERTPSNWKIKQIKTLKKKKHNKKKKTNIKSLSIIKQKNHFDLIPIIEENKWLNPFDGIIFFGDLNYRIDLPRLEIERFHNKFYKKNQRKFQKNIKNEKNKLKKKDQMNNSFSLQEMKDQWIMKYNEDDIIMMKYLKRILLFDQLSKQRGFNEIFEGFEEGNIIFPPSYKYDKQSDIFDSSEKSRCPAWTDRILFANQQKIKSKTSLIENLSIDKVDEKKVVNNHHMLELIDYYCIDARDSDHRPVCADFIINF